VAKAFVIKRRAHFADTDMAGVLHFAAYYRFMEEVEHAFWRSHGHSVMSEHGGREIGWPRVATSCEYFAPVQFEQVLELALRVMRVGNRSITYEIEFRHEGRRIALGRSTAVCCEVIKRGFRPIAIPEPLRQALVAAAETA